MAGGGDIILLPEIPFDIHRIGDAIINRLKKGKPYSIVVVAEGIPTIGGKKAAQYIAEEIEYETGFETRISVDEVYARSPVQLKDGETREDLFLTVIIDHKTHKVIWVSQSRRKEALDTFFEMIGPEACQRIKVVTCDQHKGYAESVHQYCAHADLVWDRFHLVQSFDHFSVHSRQHLWLDKPRIICHGDTKLLVLQLFGSIHRRLI
jgi:hypothetical protein